jgi:hypothetical protein
MKFCPVVPEICRGQVHGPRKERKRENNNNKKRSTNNKSPTHKFNIVRFQRPELIPDIEKFLPVSVFKMATTIPQKFNIVRFPLEIFQCWDIIIYPHIKF